MAAFGRPDGPDAARPAAPWSSCVDQALAAWPAERGGRAAAGLHPRVGGRRRPGHRLRHAWPRFGEPPCGPGTTGCAVLTASLGFPADLRATRAVAAGRGQDPLVRGQHGLPAVGRAQSGPTTCCGSRPTATRWRRRPRRWSGWRARRCARCRSTRTGILAGTTARWLLDHAGEARLDRPPSGMITPGGAGGRRGRWLTSSVRGRGPDPHPRRHPVPYSAEDHRRDPSLLGFS